MPYRVPVEAARSRSVGYVAVRCPWCEARSVAPRATTATCPGCGARIAIAGAPDLGAEDQVARRLSLEGRYFRRLTPTELAAVVLLCGLAAIGAPIVVAVLIIAVDASWGEAIASGVTLFAGLMLLATRAGREIT